MAMHNVVIYGDLLNKAERGKYMDPNKEMKPLMVSGYKRVFNVKPMRPNPKNEIAFVGAMANPDYKMNGALVELDDEEFRKLMVREISYEPEKVNAILSKEQAEVDAWLFLPSSSFMSNDLHPNPDYLKRCREGAKEFGTDFLKEWDESTFHIDGRTVSKLV